jgi:hypothetical protein
VGGHGGGGKALSVSLPDQVSANWLERSSGHTRADLIYIYLMSTILQLIFSECNVPRLSAEHQQGAKALKERLCQLFIRMIFLSRSDQINL